MEPEPMTTPILGRREAICAGAPCVSTVVRAASPAIGV